MINFDEPIDPANYFHRIGRTARFGRYGASFLFLTEQRYRAFLQSKQYVFNIKQLSSPDDLQQEAEHINGQIGRNEGLLQRAHTADTDPFERTQQRERVYLGGDSLIGSGWTDTAVQHYDQQAFRYFDPLAAADHHRGSESPGPQAEQCQAAGRPQGTHQAAEETELLDQDEQDDVDSQIARMVLDDETGRTGAGVSREEHNTMLEEKIGIATAECRDPAQMLGKRDPISKTIEMGSADFSRAEFGELCDLLLRNPGVIGILTSITANLGVQLASPQLHRAMLTRVTY